MNKDFARIYRTKEYGQVLLQTNDKYDIIWITAKVGGRLLSIEIMEDDCSSMESVFNEMTIKDIYGIIDTYIGFDISKIKLGKK